MLRPEWFDALELLVESTDDPVESILEQISKECFLTEQEYDSLYFYGLELRKMDKWVAEIE